jgi:hypothetical protein
MAVAHVDRDTLQKVLDYLTDTEQESYSEAVKDGTEANHIFTLVQRLQQSLDMMR